VGAATAGQLHGKSAHRPGGAGDQHALARAQGAVVEQPLPGGERRQRYRSGLGVPEVGRPAHQQLLRHHREVGGHTVAVEGREREHPRAGRDARDALAQLRHHAGELVRGDRGQAVHRPLELVARDRRRVHPDERLAPPGPWALGLLEGELLRSRQPQDAHHASL
jgi:hypothetical protein